MDWLLLALLALLFLGAACVVILGVILGGLILVDHLSERLYDYAQERRSCRDEGGSDQGA